MFIFERCHRSWAAVAVKYECHSTALLEDQKISLTEKLPSKDLVTPPPPPPPIKLWLLKGYLVLCIIWGTDSVNRLTLCIHILHKYDLFVQPQLSSIITDKSDVIPASGQYLVSQHLPLSNGFTSVKLSYPWHTKSYPCCSLRCMAGTLKCGVKLLIQFQNWTVQLIPVSKGW